MAVSWSDIAKVLKCREDQKYILGRLAGLGLADSCTRCGGSGHYSFNLMHGTVCFKCGGFKCQMPKLSKKLLEVCQEVANSGKLDAYLEELKRANEAKKYCNSWSDKYFALWGSHPVIDCYKRHKVNWMDVSLVESQVNHLARSLYDSVKDNQWLIQNGRFVEEKGEMRGKNIKLSNAEVLECKAKLEEAMKSLEVLIESAKAKYGDWSDEQMLALPRGFWSQQEAMSEQPGITKLSAGIPVHQA